jgi:hypothetical protein
MALQSVVMLSVANKPSRRSVVMLNCSYTECHYAECCGAEI